MTAKVLAYTAQHHIHAKTGISIQRSHSYELLAAAFGFNSIAAFNVDSLLTTPSTNLPIPSVSPELVGRVIQLGYPQVESAAIAGALVEHLIDKSISYVSLPDLLSQLLTSGEKARAHASEMLLVGLERLAERGSQQASWAIALLLRCKEPNSYLYQESVKGRILNKIEQGWVDQYLHDKPRFEKYRHHLRLAALGGVRDAAIEYAEVFDDHEFFVMAENNSEPANPLKMARAASVLGDFEANHRWLHIAAEQGSKVALEHLANTGNQWAIEKLAASGSIDAIREIIEVTSKTDLQEAWVWLHLAKLLGHDLSVSSMRAYHDGGMADGELYDDDIGGPLYVDGDEGIQLPPLGESENNVALVRAKKLFENISA